MHGPSHGGGSHHISSGGGSGGASFSSGSFSSNGFRGPRTFFFFGYPLFFTTGMLSLIVFLFVAIFCSASFIFIGADSLNEAKKQMTYMEEDRIEFERIIEFANADIDGDNYYLYKINNIDFIAGYGYFSDGYTYDGYYYENQSLGISLAANYCFEYEGLDYYQIYFKFKHEGTDKSITGLTYAQYSETQITNVSSIEIAYQIVSDSTIYSINADYDFENCPEYKHYCSDYASARTTIIVSSVITGAIVVGIVLLAVYGFKKGKKEAMLKEEKAKAEIEKTQAETDLVKEEIKKKNRVCAYCGGTIPDDATYCPGCGSRVIKDE